MTSYFKKVKGYGKLSETNIKDSLREVRVALLEADVNYKVAKDFLEKVKEKAMGEEVMTSITPGQKFIKIVYDEMCRAPRQHEQTSRYGRLTSCAGHAPRPSGFRQDDHCRETGALPEKERAKAPPCSYGRLQACRHPPARKDRQASWASRPLRPRKVNDPVQICQDAKAYAMKKGFDTLIVDTAGRLHIDEEMVDELVRQKKLLSTQGNAPRGRCHDRSGRGEHCEGL